MGVGIRICNNLLLSSPAPKPSSNYVAGYVIEKLREDPPVLRHVLSVPKPTPNSVNRNIRKIEPLNPSRPDYKH